MPSHPARLDRFPEAGAWVLEQSEAGASYREIARRLTNDWGMAISHVQVYHWLKKRREWTDGVTATRPEEPPPLELPPLETFLGEHVYWRHVETLKPVCGLSDIAEDYVEHRTAFRWDDDGNRLAGADIIAKPRRVFMTSCVLALIFYAMLRWEALSARTVLQSSKRNITAPLMRECESMLRALPVQWTGGFGVRGGIRKTANELVFEKTGSVWSIDTAGASEAQADKQGRSTRLDILHGSEVAFWQYPSALYSAAEETMPDNSGWVVAESTFPSTRTQWHPEQYFLTKKGEGKFLKAFFWPWYRHPLKRIRSATLKYDAVMSESFESKMELADKGMEELLELDSEQKAYRRTKYLKGNAGDRRRGRRENPETDEMPFESPEDTWFTEDALLRVDECIKAAESPELYRPVSPGLVAAVYARPPETESVVVGVDPAEFGRDFTAAVVIGARSLEQYAEIHGRGVDSEVADTLVWLLSKLGIVQTRRDDEGLLRILSGRSRHTVAVERQKGVKLIHELSRRGVQQWGEPGTQTHGIRTTGFNRPRLFDALAEALEGSGHEPKLVHLRSRYLGAELRGVIEVEGRPDHQVGAHDDRVIALAIALYAAPTIRVTKTAREFFGSGDARRSSRSTGRPNPIPTRPS